MVMALDVEPPSGSVTVSVSRTVVSAVTVGLVQTASTTSVIEPCSATQLIVRSARASSVSLTVASSWNVPPSPATICPDVLIVTEGATLAEVVKSTSEDQSPSPSELCARTRA